MTVHVSQAQLDQCAAEPIQTPGAIQPHGVLVCADAQGRVTHVSANCASLLRVAPEQLLDGHLSDLLTAEDADHVLQFAKAAAQEGMRRHPGPSMAITVHGQPLQLQAHVGPGGAYIIEFEPCAPLDTRTLYEQIQRVLARLRLCEDLQHLCEEVAQQMQHLLQFDRVTLYRFDSEWHGRVLAESKTADLPSYLDLHFPASDIPAQARALYHQNSLRLIPDATYTPSPILAAPHAEPGTQLDMSQCVLRSVSPVHREYLSNMGVRASMSISLFRGGRLWGLVSCSQSKPRHVPHDVRSAACLVSEFVSALIESKEETADASYYLRLKSVQSALLQRMLQGNDIVSGLTGESPSVLDATQAQGAAILFGDDVHLVGRTPTATQVRDLRRWVSEQPGSKLWHANSLPTKYAPAMAYKDTACGVIALPLTQAQNNWLFWFRPEVAQTVKWGGDPNKSAHHADTGRLRPRQSFELWKETVWLKAMPWQEAELLAAQDLKNSVIDVLLQSSEELAILNQELERSNVELDAFAYAASHDLKEPLRGIHNYTALVQRSLQAIEGTTEMQERLGAVMRLTVRMEDLVNSLLHYAQVGRVELDLTDVPMNDLVQACCEELQPRIVEKKAEVQVLDLPVVQGNRVLLSEVISNLLTNALKYNQNDRPCITVGKRPDGALFVRDNGIGIKEKNLGTVFKIFRRLHARDKFGGGTGTGLTIAKRIVERHGGTIWVESVFGGGSTFLFTLGSGVPRPAKASASVE